MMEEALHLPFLSSLDGEHGRRKRLFTNESEIMDIVNGLTDFDSILLNSCLDAEEDASEDGLSWNDFQDIANDLFLDGSTEDNWDFGSDSVMGISETVLSELAGEAWLPVDLGESSSYSGSSESTTASIAKAETPPRVVAKPKSPIHTPPATPVKQVEMKQKTAPVRKMAAPAIAPPNYAPRVVTSADLKILGNRSKQKSAPLAKFQAEEPDLRIVERSQNTAVVVKKKTIFRAGQSLLKLPVRVGSSASSFSSPTSPGKTPSPSPVKQPQSLLRNRAVTDKPVQKEQDKNMTRKVSKPFIEVDHDYCSVHPDMEEIALPPPPVLELMDVESFQEEVIVGEEAEVHDRLPSYYTAAPAPVTTEKVTLPSSSGKNAPKKKPPVALPVLVQKPKVAKQNEKVDPKPSLDSSSKQVENPSPKKQKNSEVKSTPCEKRPKTLLMPPKYQQVSYCEKILQIENDSEDELVDIEGVDDSDTFDRLPSYVTNSKAVSPRKSRENKYIDKDEEYTPRKERQKGRKKKDRVNKSTSPAKMKRKLEAIEQVREEKQKKRGRPPKKSEPERKKVKTKEKKRSTGSKPSVLTDSESSDEERFTKLSKPGAFQAIYSSDDDNEENNNNESDAKEPLDIKEEELPLEVKKEEVEAESGRVRTISWKSNNSYEDLGGTYQNELGFTIFGDFGEGNPAEGELSVDGIPDDFPMDEIKVETLNKVEKEEDEVNDNQEEFDLVGDIKEEAVEFEIEIMDIDGDCVSVDLNGLLKADEGDNEEENEVKTEEDLKEVGQDGEEKPVELRLLRLESSELDDGESELPKKQRRKLTLSDYLIRKEYERNICSSTSRMASPSSQDVEEGEIQGDLTETSLEEAVRQLNFKPRERKRRESEESDFYKKVKDHKRKRDTSCSSSSSSDSYDSESSESSEDSDDLRSRSPSPFLKARRKSRSRMRYSSSRSRRRGSYSTDSSSSECSSSARSRSRDSSSSSQDRRHRRRSYSSFSDCSVSSYDVKSKSKRKERSTSRSESTDERRVIYLSGLSKNISKRDIHKKFIRFGPIKDIKIKFRSSGDPYAFVTFYHGRDALDAIEHGNDDKTKPKCEISFGGRRRFCKENYADLDGQGDPRYSNKPLDFDALLRETKEKLTKRC